MGAQGRKGNDSGPMFLRKGRRSTVQAFNIIDGSRKRELAWRPIRQWEGDSFWFASTRSTFNLANTGLVINSQSLSFLLLSFRKLWEFNLQVLDSGSFSGNLEKEKGMGQWAREWWARTLSTSHRELPGGPFFPFFSLPGSEEEKEEMPKTSKLFLLFSSFQRKWWWTRWRKERKTKTGSPSRDKPAGRKWMSYDWRSFRTVLLSHLWIARYCQASVLSVLLLFLKTFSLHESFLMALKTNEPTLRCHQIPLIAWLPVRLITSCGSLYLMVSSSWLQVI